MGWAMSSKRFNLNGDNRLLRFGWVIVDDTALSIFQWITEERRPSLRSGQ